MQTTSAPSRKQLKRFEHTHSIRFLTFSCAHRLPLFNNDQIKQVFVDRLAAIHAEGQIELFGWVVMPEHIHLLVRPSHPGQKLGRILQSLKRPVAERVIRRWRELDAPILDRLETANGTCRFWQPGGGYDRNLRSSQDCEEKLHYIHRNPVKRGLVQHEKDWEWSSARWVAGSREAGIPLNTPIWSVEKR